MARPVRHSVDVRDDRGSLLCVRFFLRLLFAACRAVGLRRAQSSRFAEADPFAVPFLRSLRSFAASTAFHFSLFTFHFSPSSAPRS
jgi:hypothetical protein